MKVRYLGESSPLELFNGKIYDVLSVEGGWYRVVDETEEDYLFPPECFEVVELNDGTTPVLSFEEAAAISRQKHEAERLINGKVRPQFKYHPNLYRLDILESFEGVCECCGKQDNLFYQGMYTAEDVDYLCLDCIADGKAAEKFNGDFVQDWDPVDNPEATDELLHRTPGYLSWQGESWKACCNDYCAYLGPVGTAELEEMNIADDLFESDGSFDGWEGARNDLAKNGWLCGHLFQCLHCGKFHMVVEAN